MKPGLRVSVVGLALAVWAGPTLAHHSFDAEYDRSETVMMKGAHGRKPAQTGAR